jgi:hypothetical protein
MKEMKRFILATVFILSVLLFFTIAPLIGSEKGTENESKCISCHTNLKDLMRLCWKIEKMRPKQAESAETSGKG